MRLITSFSNPPISNFEQGGYFFISHVSDRVQIKLSSLVSVQSELVYACLCFLDLDRVLTRDDEVDFNENTLSVLGANAGSTRLESGARCRRV